MELECVKISSITYANKAKDVLKNAGIRSKMKKVSSEKDGCAYLLELDKRFFEKANEILTKNEIKFTRCEYH